MRYLVILAILLFNTTTFALDERLSNDEKLADLLFPSESKVKLEQLRGFTAAEFSPLQKRILHQLESDKMCFVIANHDNPHAMFKKFDFSGDSIDDVILSSYCGAMEIRNFIWIRKSDSSEFAGFIEGTPLKFYRNKESGPFSIVVSAGWCCAGYVGSISLYQLKEDQGRLLYQLDKKAMVFGGVTMPEKKIKPVRFKVAYDKYRLRRSPEIIDELDEYMSGLTNETVYGNIIAEFAKGSSGEALAEYKDKTGRVWWFVLMDKDAKTTINHFYDDEGGYKTGWMSSRYVEVIK